MKTFLKELHLIERAFDLSYYKPEDSFVHQIIMKGEWFSMKVKPEDVSMFDKLIDACQARGLRTEILDASEREYHYHNSYTDYPRKRLKVSL